MAKIIWMGDSSISGSPFHIRPLFVTQRRSNMCLRALPFYFEKNFAFRQKYRHRKCEVQWTQKIVVCINFSLSYEVAISLMQSIPLFTQHLNTCLNTKCNLTHGDFWSKIRRLLWMAWWSCASHRVSLFHKNETGDLHTSSNCDDLKVHSLAVHNNVFGHLPVRRNH